MFGTALELDVYLPDGRVIPKNFVNILELENQYRDNKGLTALGYLNHPDTQHDLGIYLKCPEDAYRAKTYIVETGSFRGVWMEWYLADNYVYEIQPELFDYLRDIVADCLLGDGTKTGHLPVHTQLSLENTRRDFRKKFVKPFRP